MSRDPINPELAALLTTANRRRTTTTRLWRTIRILNNIAYTLTPFDGTFNCPAEKYS
jgi:hypothetical protein